MLPKSKTFERYLTDEEFRRRVHGLFDKVDLHVDEFARFFEIALDRWYHDLPAWILRWEEKNVTRLIHLGPTSDDMPAVSAAIDAYQDDPAKNVRYGLEHTIVLEPIPGSYIMKRPFLVKALLFEAYDRAKSLSAQDFTERSSFTAPRPMGNGLDRTARACQWPLLVCVPR